MLESLQFLKTGGSKPVECNAAERRLKGVPRSQSCERF
jgi:hypothetical protein